VRGGYIVHLPEFECADAASVAQEERRLVAGACNVKEDIETDIGVSQGMGGVLAAVRSGCRWYSKRMSALLTVSVAW
jgi:hypothetical protein